MKRMTVSLPMCSVDFMDTSLSPEEQAIADRIEELRAELGDELLILGHHYQRDSIVLHADFLGDSFMLSQKAAESDAKYIVFCGVHFMGETAKILNPTKKVVVPDFNAGCSLADSVPVAEFAALKAKHPNAIVVSYINCSADIKAMTDIICTSSNAVQIVESIPADRYIIFAPDANLGRYVAHKTGRELILWEGACMVHIDISLEKLAVLKQEYPDALLIAHPECKEVILKEADYVGSTTALLKFVETSPSSTFIVATEAGILHKMKHAVPHKHLIPAPSNEQNTCACSECPYMKMNTLEKLYNAMFYELPEIQFDSNCG